MTIVHPFPGNQNLSPVNRRFLESIANPNVDWQVAVSGLQATDANLQQEIIVIQGDVSTIQGDVSTIQGDVSTIQNDIGSIQIALAGFYQYQSAKTLTESTATSIFEVSLPQGESIGGRVNYTIKADDGTDFQVVSGICLFAAVNKAGTLTLSQPNLEGSETVACSSGTLTNEVTVSTGTNKIIFKLNATSSLTQTSLTANWRVWWHGSATSVTPL